MTAFSATRPFAAGNEERDLIDARLVFFALIVASMLLRAELFTMIAAAVFLGYAAFSSLPANLFALRVMAPFLALAVLGFVQAGDNLPYEIGKDIWYVIKLCLCLGAGALIGKRMERREGFDSILVALAWLGVALTLVIMRFMPQGIPVIGRFDEVPKLPILCLGALPIVLDRLRAAGGNFRWRDAALLVSLIAACIVSDSRILLVAFALMAVAWAGVFNDRRRAVLGSIGVVLAAAVLWQLLPEYRGGELTAFNKLRRSLDEMMFTDAYDPTAMIMNWRGFEAYNAQLMFDNGSFFNKVFGFGLGAEVDLGRTVEMSTDMRYQYLPTLHNGYYYLLIKFGLLGVAVYLFSVLRWFRWKEVPALMRGAVEIRILRGLVLIVLASTAVITGLFNKDQMHGVAVVIAVVLAAIHSRADEWAGHARSPARQVPPVQHRAEAV